MYSLPSALINNVTYLGQKVPTLYTALGAPPNLKTNTGIYGQINPLVVNSGDIVEIVINNLTPGGHPWHMHGHQFQVVARGNGTYNPAEADPHPMVRDVAGVQPGGYVVFRFQANNPGVQLREFPDLLVLLCALVPFHLSFPVLNLPSPFHPLY